MRDLSPDAICVKVLPEKKLQITFSNGEIKVFNAMNLLFRKCYSVLKSNALFNKAYIENGCVTWPGNLDIDPDWLYEDSVSIETLSS